DGIAQSQQADVAAARALKPPAALQLEQLSMVEALQLRVDGLEGLAGAFGRTAKFKKADPAAAVLAVQAQRLVASDVVWTELFRLRSIAELQRQKIQGVR